MNIYEKMEGISWRKFWRRCFLYFWYVLQVRRLPKKVRARVSNFWLAAQRQKLSSGMRITILKKTKMITRFMWDIGFLAEAMNIRTYSRQGIGMKEGTTVASGQPSVWMCRFRVILLFLADIVWLVGEIPIIITMMGFLPFISTGTFMQIFNAIKAQ